MSRAVRVLHLEDDAADAELVAEALRAGGLDCSLVRVVRQDDFEREVRTGDYQAIFSDYKLPGYDGNAALAFALENRADVPFILVSGAIGDEAAVRMMLGGATDYVLKEHLSRLVPALQRALREAENRLKGKHAEQSLLASERRYRLLFEAAKDGILLLDAATAQILDVNPSASELLEYPAAQMLGRNPKEIGLCGDDHATCEAFHEVLSCHRTSHSCVRLFKAGGRYVDVELVSSAYEVDGHRVIQVNIRDITARKAAEDEVYRLNRELEARVAERTAALTSANAFVHALLESMVEGIVAVDLRGTITWFNERFLEVCRVPEGVHPTSLDQVATELLGPQVQEPEAFAARERELRAHPECDSFDVLEFRDQRVLERISRPQRIDDHIVGKVWSYRDITERRKLERQLQQAQKLEAVGQLAAGIAHELNTPAQFVGDNLKFLRDASLAMNEVQRAYRQLLAEVQKQGGFEGEIAEVRAAEEAADLAYLEEHVPTALAAAEEGIGRMSTIVRAMKEFAHPARTEADFADINRALEATLTIARNEYKYVAEVTTELGTLPPVMCSIGDLNQVFLNLIVNAAHAIGDRVEREGGRGRIVVRTQQVDDATVTIEVGDTGCGIPVEIRERVFEPFFTTKPVGRGSGQGLAIARTIIVGKHGGTLTFRSEVGRGTTFIITLPIDGAAERRPEGQSQVGSA